MLFRSPCIVIGVKPAQWKQICDGVVTPLDEYSDTLLRNVQTFVQIGDTQGVDIIRSSCVGCLAHLAVLCDLVGRLEPNYKLLMDAICDSSLKRLGYYLSREEGASLRWCRRIVAEALSDIVARLPDPSPPPRHNPGILRWSR